MEILLLVVFVIVEIGFAVFEMTQKASKKDWSLKRLSVSGAEAGIYLIATLLPGIDFSFRFKGLLGVLIIKIVFGLIRWLVFRKNEKGKGKAAMVFGALGSLAIIAGSMIPAFVFADYQGLPLTGKYETETCRAIVTDSSRDEEFEADGSKREIPVYFYYPSNAETEELHSMPMIVFSHGAFGYYQSNSSTFMELASHGYVVVSLDHPYHSFFTKDTEGKLITVNPEFFQNAMEIGNSDQPDELTYPISSKWMELRISDVGFVLDTLKKADANSLDECWTVDDSEKGRLKTALNLMDVNRIGLMGHSLGGATAVTLGRRDDVMAVVDMDGSMIGEWKEIKDGKVVYNDEPYTTPLLNFSNQEHHDQSVLAEEMNYPYVNNDIMRNASEGYAVYIRNSGHMNFTDLPLFSPVLSKMLGTGDVDSLYCITKVNELTLDFFDCYLKDGEAFSPEECY